MNKRLNRAGGFNGFLLIRIWKRVLAGLVLTSV
jgi:hypothetical protein